MTPFRLLVLAFPLLAGFAGGVAAQAQTQCVSNALAGGTVDHITIPLQPCALSTNLLILTAAGANGIAQPTLQMAGGPQLNIYTSTGTAPGIGAIPGAGATILLTSTGTAWKIVSGNASTTFSGVLTVPNGGTGDSTLTTNGLLVGQGTGAVSTVAAGSTGQYLGGNTSSPPSWKTISSSLVSSWSAGTTGLTPSSATTGAITLAGTLGTGNGGTGLTGFTTGDLFYASSSSVISKLAAASTGNVLLSGTSPSWGKVDLTAAVTGLLPVANGGTGLGTATANGLLYGNGTSAFGVVGAGTTGQVLAATTGSPPAWSNLANFGVSQISFGTTGLTPSSLTGGTVTVAGTLGVANGGTGAGTLTSHGVLLGAGTAAISGLTAGTTGQYLKGATGSDPSWGTLASDTVSTFSAGSTGLTPNSATAGAVTLAGTLGVANGGTGQASYTDGQLLIGNSTGNTLAKATLTAGTNISIANGNGSISISASAAGLTAIVSKTTSFSASSNAQYCVDSVTGAAALTATLPASPANNDIIVFNACSNYNLYNLILARNGNNIQGRAGDMTVSKNNASFSVQFVTSYGWRVF